MGYISRADLTALGEVMKKNAYGEYLLQIAAEESSLLDLHIKN